MINKNLIELTEKLNNNSKYLGNMKNIKNSEELYNYCISLVPGYSKEEFDNFMQHIINTSIELKALSDDKLASVSGGTVAGWLKSKMPKIPEDSKEFRKKVKKDKNEKGGEWNDNINTTTQRLSQLSMFIKLGEMIYFDDIDTMSPEEIAMFALDLTGQY